MFCECRYKLQLFFSVTKVFLTEQIMARLSYSLTVQKLRYKHYKEYIDGWFEIHDERQRKRLIEGNISGNKRIVVFSDHEYHNQIQIWRHKLRDNDIRRYLDVNSQITECIKRYLPKSFTRVNTVYSSTNYAIKH